MNNKQTKVITVFKQYIGNISKVCRVSGISRMTFYRYMKIAKFRKEIERIIDEHFDWLTEVCSNACKERTMRKVVKYKHKTITTTWTELPSTRTVLLCMKIMFKIDAYYEKRYMKPNDAVKQICKVFQIPQYKTLRLAA